jgi:hypothetical protein
MTTTQHTIDARILFNGSALLTRVEYQYEPDPSGLALLTVVDARILADDHDVPPKVTAWAQDWLDLDGYDRAFQHAEWERR